MKHTYLTCGKIVSTHGVRGAVKAEPWCDSPAVLAGFDRVYFREGDTYTPRAVRGVSSHVSAIARTNSTVSPSRNTSVFVNFIRFPTVDYPAPFAYNRVRTYRRRALRGAVPLYYSIHGEKVT